jgi:hypothetical protein
MRLGNRPDFSVSRRFSGDKPLGTPVSSRGSLSAQARGFFAGSAPVSASCASIIMRMSRWVGMLAFAASAFRVASSAAGRRRLIDASLRASSKRTLLHAREAVFGEVGALQPVAGLLIASQGRQKVSHFSLPKTTTRAMLFSTVGSRGETNVAESRSIPSRTT